MQPQRRLRVARQLDGDLAGEGLVHPAHPQHLDQLRQLALGVHLELAALLGHLQVELLVLRLHRRVLAQRHRDRTRDQPGHTGEDDGARIRPAARHAGHERRVADQPVHRAEDGRAQPAAGHVGMTVVVRLGLGQRLGATHSSSASAPSGTVGSSCGVGRATWGHRDPRRGRELAAGAVDVLAAGVADRRRHAGGAQPGDELALRRQRAGVPDAARRRVERDQVHVRQLPGQQRAEPVGALGWSLMSRIRAYSIE